MQNTTLKSRMNYHEVTPIRTFKHVLTVSAKAITRFEGEDIGSVEEEFCLGKGCAIFRFADSAVDSESNGFR